MFEKHWAAPYWTPENLCANCHHPRNDHLGEAPLKGMPKDDDSGWCTLPAGTCIFQPCGCKHFKEEARPAERLRSSDNEVMG